MFRLQLNTVEIGEFDNGANLPVAPRIVDTSPRVSPINPVTGLATDYLNHFNEAIMLLEMLPDCPECRDDLRAWMPMSYREHFRQSRLGGRDDAIAAYEKADPVARDMLDALAGTMTTLIEHSRDAIAAEQNASVNARVAERAATWLKLLAAQAGAVINGRHAKGGDGTPQSNVDRMIG